MEARNQPQIPYRYRQNKQAGVFCSECGQSALVCGGTHGQGRSAMYTTTGWTIAGLPTETVLDAVPGSLIVDADRTSVPSHHLNVTPTISSPPIVDEMNGSNGEASKRRDRQVDATDASSKQGQTITSPQVDEEETPNETVTLPRRTLSRIHSRLHPPKKQFRSRRIQKLTLKRGIVIAGALLALVVIAVLIPLLLRPVRPQVTIRITPIQHTLTQIEQVNAVLTPTTAQEVAARLIQITTSSKSASAHATGKGYTASLPARGNLTLTNQASSWQTIPTGSEFTGRSGVTVVTDTTVQIPPVDLSTNPPTLGQAVVSAHTKQGGTATNIAMLDINDCCTVGIAVRNLVAFSGGKDGQPYAVLKTSDIQAATTPLEQELTTEATTSVHSRVSHTEQLVEAPRCTPDVHASQGDGAQVDNTPVSVTVTCTGEVYQPNQVQARAVARLLEAPTANAQTNADLRSYTPTITGKKILRAAISDSTRKTITLTVWIQGVWTHQFNALQCTWLASHLAGTGRNKKQAEIILSPRNGIERAAFSWQPDGQTLFPSDPAQITIEIVQPGPAIARRRLINSSLYKPYQGKEC